MAYVQRVGGSAALVMTVLMGAATAQSPASGTAVLTPGVYAAQGAVQANPPSRLAGDWRSSPGVVIPGSQPPAVNESTDLGPAPAGTRLDRMLLLLEPSTPQRQALDAELADQLDPKSSDYHHWLTTGAFADAYANSRPDVNAIASWLESHGFAAAPLPSGRGWIEFSGTVAQVEEAFQTRVHAIATASGTRPVLVEAIAVPGALRPLIHGLVSLDGVIAAPAMTAPEPIAGSTAELARTTSALQAKALSPQLAAQLLHLDSLQTSGVNGKGETIAIAARSNVETRDVAEFRATFGLTASALQIVPNGADPGRTSDEAEAVLSAAWAGAAAPGAQILLVPAGTTSATDGLDLSLAAIVDEAVAHTVAVGFSACEASLSEARQAFYAAVYRQAAAEGMAIVAAAGDNGASACQATGAGAANTGYGVNALASTPWNTSVGVAALAESGTTADGHSLAGWSPVSAADPANAGGGGKSLLYSAPAWQPLPAQDSTGAGGYARLMPDVALPTAVDSGLNRGLAYCLSRSATGSVSSGGCVAVRSGGSAAAAAMFAGIASLLAAKDGPQGNLAPELYELSRRGGIFNDVQEGSNKLFCAAGSTECDAIGQIGFTAVAGYDMATGLGSVDAQKLVSAWATPEATGTGAASVNLSVTPTVPNTTYNPTAQITLTANVVSGTGGATPTGTVLFADAETGGDLNPSGSTLDANGVANYTFTSGLKIGGNNITAIYSGDATYASVTSQPLVVTAEPSTTSLTVVPATTKPTAGLPFTVTVNITVGTPPPGTVAPTGKVTLNVDGLPTATASLVTTGGVTSATFPSVTINAAGDHPLQAVYAGDANYAASTAPPVTVTIGKGATVTALTAVPPTLTAGMPETFTATIAPTNVASGTTYTITGTVSFYDGTTLLGTAVINANTASLANVTLSPAVLHTITAVYSGDTSWAASTSNAITLQSVLLPDVVTLELNINTIGPGQLVTLAASVTPLLPPATNIEQNPTGNVIFYNGTTVMGTVALTAGPNNTSSATLISGTLPGGNNVLTAYYVGDLYFAPGISNPVTIDVQDFSITPSPTNPPTNLTIVKGTSGSASFIVTGLGGYNDLVQVVCSVPTQVDMTCAATPQQVRPTAVVSFTVQTYAAGGTPTAGNNRAPLWPPAAGGTALAVLVFFVLPAGRRRRMFTERTRRFVAVLLLLAGLGGAGIGCSNSVTAPQNTGTPLGVATLTIVATAYIDNTVINRTVFLTVNVIPPGSSTAVPVSNPRR
jgi:subtilase family serine protease